MQKPDFTGTWKFNSEKSVLEIPAPDSTVMVIDHREPHFHLERIHVTGTRTDTFTIDLTTNNEAVTQVHEGIEIHARMFWNGEALVFDTDVKRGTEQGKNVVSYRLADDGQSITAHEQLNSRELSYKNKWVLDKE